MKLYDNSILYVYALATNAREVGSAQMLMEPDYKNQRHRLVFQKLSL